MATSENEQVLERTPEPPVDLNALAGQLLAEAASAGDGRAALTLNPGGGSGAKQTLIAARAGREFGPKSWNGTASLHVLRGWASVSEPQSTVGAGGWTLLTADDTTVTADEDLVALLTVVVGD